MRYKAAVHRVMRTSILPLPRQTSNLSPSPRQDKSPLFTIRRARPPYRRSSRSHDASKYASETFVRDEIAHAAEDIKKEIIAHIDRLNSYTAVSFDRSVEPEAAGFRDKIETISKMLPSYDEKLGMLVEGGARRVVQHEKGEEWVKGVTIRSLSDLVSYIRTLCGEGSVWAKQASNQLINFLNETNAPVRTIQLLNNLFTSSEEDSWKVLQDLVLENPLVIDDEVQPTNISA
ncbi:hypothetical protein K440DRAFT_633168 [Wilcoxina mikolae CBS 423.85]|nr:hypothetical protein K440DRAFT_633168 [Wilcoxina mikolae CBS 423.85]